jgi:NitT/TauT family transport system substrate-binding protein
MREQSNPPDLIRIAQAHRPIFYLPHVVAEAIGAFRQRALATQVIPMATSDQWRMLATGAADIAIGGPMRSMKLLEEGRRILTFAAAVAGSPWVLVGPADIGNLELADLVGCELLDDREIATARLCIQGLLRLAGHDPGGVRLTTMPGAELRRRLGTGEGTLALMPMERALGLVAKTDLHVVQELGRWTGPLPWSAYQALPETMARRGSQLAAYRDAIGDALRLIQEAPVEDLARLTRDWFVGVEEGQLENALRAYRRMGVWAPMPEIPEQDFRRFTGLLSAAGWLKEEPRYADLVAEPG